LWLEERKVLCPLGDRGSRPYATGIIAEFRRNVVEVVVEVIPKVTDVVLNLVEM